MPTPVTRVICLDKDGFRLDNNSFYLTFPYNGRYRAVKNCNVLLDALDNTECSNRDGERRFPGLCQYG